MRVQDQFQGIFNYRILYVPFSPLVVLFRAIRNHQTRRLLIFPYLVGFISFIAILTISIYFRVDLFESLFKTDLAWWWDIVTIPALLGFSALASLAVMLATSELLFDQLIRALLIQFNLNIPTSDKSVVLSVLKGLAIKLPIILTLFVFQILGFVTSILALPTLILSCFFLGYEFYSTSLHLFGVNNRQQIKLMLSDLHFLIVIGIVMYCYLMVPVLGALFTPAGYILVCERVKELMRRQC
jgi:hypothetical protein